MSTGIDLQCSTVEKIKDQAGRQTTISLKKQAPILREHRAMRDQTICADLIHIEPKLHLSEA